MTSIKHPRLRRAVKLTPPLASAIVAACGLAVLIGWQFDIDLLKSLLHPDKIPMNPATAVCMIICGVAIELRARANENSWARTFIYFGSFLIVLVASLRLVGYDRGWLIAPDQLIFYDKLADNVMAPNTAMAFILFAFALTLLDIKTADGFHPAQSFILTASAISVLALIGYLYQLTPLYGVKGYVPMALNTAICFALLSAGLLCTRPTRQPLAMFLDDTVGGTVARRLLPAAFIVPLALGWLRILSVRAGWISAEFALALLVLSIIVVFNALVWWNAQIQRNIDIRRHRVEDELRESEARHRAVMQQSGEGIYLVDLETRRIIEANDAIDRLLGYEPGHVQTLTVYDLIDDTREGVDTRLKRLMEATEPLRGERQYRRRDGALIDVEASATVINYAGRRVSCTVVHDITRRKRAQQELNEKHQQLESAHEQLKQAQSAMVQSEKLAGLGQMVAGVAHEINNPLAFVANNVAVLQRDVRGLGGLIQLYAQADELIAQHNANLIGEIRDLAERMDLVYTMQNLDEMLNRSRDGLRRIQQIVKDLREFARLDASDLQDADLNAGIESTTNIVRGVAKRKQVTIELQLQPLPPITCYPAKINQVIMNLITNAIDACSENGKVIVTSGLSASRQVQVEVIDNGSGIPPDIRARIFDPFFTTKAIGHGTGLGLSISYGIVKDHGGEITVYSEVGRGTKFTVTLPQKSPSKSKTA